MGRRDWLLLGFGLLLVVIGLLVVGSEPLAGLGLVVVGGVTIFVVSPVGIDL